MPEPRSTLAGLTGMAGPLAKEVSYVGIDPGQAGGIAGVGPRGVEIASSPMPKTEADVWKQVKSIGHHFDAFAVIEKVHAMPQQGVTSMFTFGMGYGGLRMALIAAGIPFEEVTPQCWQKALGIPKRRPHDKVREVVITKGKNKGKVRQEKYGGETDAEWKNRLKAFAQRLHPKAEVTLQTADALLIATYCQRKQEGRL